MNFKGFGVKQQRLLLFVVLGALVALLGWRAEGLQRADWVLGDVLASWNAVESPAERIVIVDIDDVSLQQFGSWPWSRSLMGALVERLVDDHVDVVVGLDLLFPEHREGDEVLVSQVESGAVCLAVAFDLEPGNRVREIGELGGGVASEKGWSAQGYIGHFAELAEAASCVGHITPLTDGDGLIRRFPDWVVWEGRAWGGLAAAMAGFELESVEPFVSRIPFRVAPDQWRSISASEVLMGDVPPGTLDGAFVLVGSSAMGLSDRISTPIHPWLPGVVVHAELLNHYLNPPDLVVWLHPRPLLFSGLVLLVLFWMFARFSVPVGAAAGVGLLLGWLGYYAWVWPVASGHLVSLPVVTIGLTLLLVLPFEWLVVQRRNRYITKLFKDYLPQSVVDQLLQTDEDVLTPRVQPITVMFADIEGFTVLARELSTDELASLTRDVLSLMTEEIHDQGGTLDKYIGDAVMAFWNAPMPQVNHADLAVRAALGIVARLRSMRFGSSAQVEVRVRIGINTGEAMVGDLGTGLRHAYTAIGHSVNHAHRLHDSARDFGAFILISQSTFSALNSSYKLEDFEVESSAQNNYELDLS